MNNLIKVYKIKIFIESAKKSKTCYNNIIYEVINGCLDEGKCL